MSFDSLGEAGWIELGNWVDPYRTIDREGYFAELRRFQADLDSMAAEADFRSLRKAARQRLQAIAEHAGQLLKALWELDGASYGKVRDILAVTDFGEPLPTYRDMMRALLLLMGAAKGAPGPRGRPPSEAHDGILATGIRNRFTVTLMESLIVAVDRGLIEPFQAERTIKAATSVTKAKGWPSTPRSPLARTLHALMPNLTPDQARKFLSSRWDPFKASGTGKEPSASPAID